MTNLFSSFDPMVGFMHVLMPLNWLSCMIVLFMLPQMYWILGSQFSKSIESTVLYLEDELRAVFSALVMPGTVFLFIGVFIFIVFSNFMGLFPYIFTCTSHMSLTVTLALPIWLGSMMWSVGYQSNSLLAHLVPTGTPGPLMPVMVLIETVSSVIRPGTLSVRLGANMMAGHLLLTLLGSQGPQSSFMLLGILTLALILLIMLELGVACIQAYVFTILSSLYLNELSNLSFNKKMI